MRRCPKCAAAQARNAFGTDCRALDLKAHSSTLETRRTVANLPPENFHSFRDGTPFPLYFSIIKKKKNVSHLMALLLLFIAHIRNVFSFVLRVMDCSLRTPLPPSANLPVYLSICQLKKKRRFIVNFCDFVACIRI